MSQPLLEYINFRVRSKLNMVSAAQPIIDQILTDIPIHVKAAVISMQRLNMLPPKEVQYNLEREAEAHYNTHTQEELYRFLSLPVDFQSIKHFEIYPQIEKTFMPVANEHEARRRYIQNGDYTYLVRMNSIVPDGPVKPRLILTPWPELTDGVLILNYNTDGSVDGLDYLDERYWEAVSDQVLLELNLVSPDKAERSLGQLNSQNINMNGNARVNNGPARLRAKFFGGKGMPF